MFGTIRRHQTWLWAIIITLTIISFVVYFNPTAQNNPTQGAATDVFELNGKRVTPKMLKDAKNEVRLIYFLNTRKWPEEDPDARQYDFDNDAIIRLFRTSKAEEAGIRISDDTLRAMAQRFLGDMPLDRFAKEALAPGGLTPDDLERFLHNEAMWQQLSMVIGSSARLITPAEGEALYRRDNQEVGGDIVFLHLTNYLSKVVITNGALTNWYAMRGYHTPERVQVSYVEFPRTNFVAEAEKRFAEITNLNQLLRDSYFKIGPNNFKDTNGVPLSESNALVQIRENELDRAARMIAARKANEFANQLYDKQPVTVEHFVATAASNSLPVQVTIPFGEEGPTNLDVSPRFAQVAFSLNPTNNPVAVQPIEGEKGFYIIALKELIPSRPEPYAEVAGRVEEDYKRFNAFTLSYSAATNFIAKATNGLAQGKTFEELAQQEGLKAETLPPISPSTASVTNLEERIDVNRLKNALLSLEPGKVSNFQQNPPDGGFIVYSRAKLPIDEAKLRAELPKFLGELRAKKQNEILNQWFRKQVEQAKLPLPNRPKRPGQS
jgi:hypothetical protein